MDRKPAAKPMTKGLLSETESCDSTQANEAFPNVVVSKVVGPKFLKDI